MNVHDAAPIVGEDDEDEQDPAGERGDREEVDRDLAQLKTQGVTMRAA